MYFNPKSRWLRGITVAMIMLWLAFGGQTFAFGHTESAPTSTDKQSAAPHSGVMSIENVGQFNDAAYFQMLANSPEVQEFESIPTSAANDWEYFTIGGNHYLAVANLWNDFTWNIDSKLYRWNGSSFVEFQSIPTHGAHGWEFFTIGSDHYLAVAHLGYGPHNYNINSELYRWDGSSFVAFQSIPTNGATDWRYFTIDGEHYLAVAHYYNGSTYNIESKLYRWDGTSFVEFQSIPTNAARHWEYFTIGSDDYLVVANSRNDSTHNLDSKLYRWDGSIFVEFQSISTMGANRWEFFTIGSEHYLAVANRSDGTTNNVDSKIYRWNGSTFVEFQSIATTGAAAWQYFTIDSNHYLALSNYKNNFTWNIDSKLYRWDGTSFVESQSIPTNGASDWEHFTIDSEHYLAVANYHNDTTRNIDSKLYKLVMPSMQVSKTGPTTAIAGNPITYTLTVTNSGNALATTVTITDRLPTGATYISGGTLAGDVVSWTVPTLPPTSTTSVQFVVTATETITNSDYAVTANGGYSATGSEVVVTEISSLLAIHALAFNGKPTTPPNLSPTFQPTMDGIIAATKGAPDKRAIVLIDQDQEADTRIFEVFDGVVTPIVGLPDGNGLLSSALNEYDMTDGSTLGGFLKWTLNEYATNATKTSLSYVSHGTFLAPAVDLSTIFTDTTTLNHRSAQSSPLFPLPSTIYVKSRLTDHYPQAGLITPHALQVALDVGTNGGSNALDVLDLVHCFSASIEEFYELSNPNGTPYSEVMVGSPNYSYFAPEMLGRALAAVDTADDAATMANSIMSAYDELIDEADQADGDADVDHPRTLVALESSKVPPIKNIMDEMASYMMQEFASNPTATKNKLAAAYTNANAYYDTTYCAPQDWELAAPDGLVDIEAFMSQIANQFGTLSGTGLRALQVAGAVNQAVISHSPHNGSPWFADPLTPTWTLSGANISGLALYADLEGVADGTERDLSWHARFYTDTTSIDSPNDNPYPYLFVQGGVNGQTWGDVFNRFWQVKRQTEGVSVRTSACLPEFPPILQEGELSVERVIFPVTGTVYHNYPTTLAAAIHAAQISTNPLVRFNVYDASNTLIFSDTVAAGYLVTGTHYIEATELWTPTITGSFTLEVLVDADNRFLEADESNNSATMTDMIFTGTPFEMSATTLNNRQWFDSRTIDLDLNSNQPLDFLVVQIYEYIPGVDPNTQVPSTPHQVVIPSPSLPNVSFDLPLIVNPGPITLHLWAIAGTDINQELVKVTFNYAPSSRSLGTSSDYYLFDGAAGDAISITLSVESGDANLYIWQPGNLWTAQMVNVASGQAGTIGFSPALAGEYLVMAEGLTTGTEYTISSLRNGQVGGLAPLIGRGNTNSSTTAVTTVQKAKPTFIEPIPDMPAAQIPATIATSVTLQGRNDVPPPHPRWSVPLNVTLTIPGESSPSYTFTPTTDDYGHFTITGIEPGRYEVRVKKASSLQTLVTHEFSAGSNNLDVGILYEGDANNDNNVTILDFSVLASTFGKCEGNDDYDSRADFNGDGCITILDFSLLASNFGQGGDQEAAREATTSEASLNNAALLVEPLTNAVNVGDIFTATVLIEADNQAIDGAQANLNFDPAVVEVQLVSGGEQLALELLNQFDNKQGTIDFAAGTLVDFPSGAALELLHIQFKALAASEDTTLAFQFDAPRQSDVTFGGSSLLSTHTDGTIIIQAAPTSITLDAFDAAKWQQLPLMSALLLALMAIGSLLMGIGWQYRRS